MSTPKRTIRNRQRYSPPSLASAFSRRFALTEFGAESVLLDLVTGSFYRLNAFAARVCRSLMRGEGVEGAAGDLVESFGLSPEQASRDVRAVLEQLEGEAAVTGRNPIRFELDADGFLLRWQGETILRLGRDGERLSYLARSAHPVAERRLHLQWAAPHILALQHQPVLHASAVEWGEGALAFSGTSGAGKTTLARCFAARGARLIAEDLLLLSLVQGRPHVFVDGEAALRQWVAERSVLLAGPGPMEIPTAGLAEVLRGPALPLRDLLFLDPTRRSGDAIRAEPIAPPDALVRLLENGFGEIPHRRVWTDLLEVSRAVVAAVPVGAATVPGGLAALEAAVRRYGA